MLVQCYFCDVEIEFSNDMQLNFRRPGVLQFHLPEGTEENNEDHSLAEEISCVTSEELEKEVGRIQRQ